MIKATMNQLANVDCSFQNIQQHKRVLCVCSAAMLRSATIANVLTSKYKYNCRSAGTADYALIPVSEALLAWADEIVCAEVRHKKDIITELEYDSFSPEYITNIEKKIQVLGIPDDFSYMEDDLILLIRNRYNPNFNKV